MPTLAAVQEMLDRFRSAPTLSDLESALAEACARLGFRHYALSQHVDFGQASCRGVRLHNYPDSWVECFDRKGLGLTDPVHRASHTTLTGFRWREVPRMIPLTPHDRDILAEARAHGLADGFTIPAHVPGEILGSCSFAVAANDVLDDGVLPVAQLTGQFAFEAGRRLTAARPVASAAQLTTRQLECIVFVGRGKTDAEIAEILGIRPLTVTEHLRHARDRYNAAARAVLPVRALYDGSISFADMLAR